MTYLPVRLVVDRSALLLYLAGSMHVAEPLHEVISDGVAFGVPLVAAAEAFAEVDDHIGRAALHGLLSHPSCALLPTDCDLAELAYWRRATARVDLAVCVMAALEHDAAILSADGKDYGDGLPIIDAGGVW